MATNKHVSAGDEGQPPVYDSYARLSLPALAVLLLLLAGDIAVVHLRARVRS